MLGSGFIEFELEYSETKNLSVGDVVRSGVISVAGHVWRIYCYPHGNKKANKGIYLSLYLRLVSKAKNVTAIFEASIRRSRGRGHVKRCTKVYPPNGVRSQSRGWHEFVRRSILEYGNYVKDGRVTFLCGITVLRDSSIAVPASDIQSHLDSSIAVPASDIQNHLGSLLDCSDGADVSFCVNGQTFHAHRAILAAQSPVFKAELFGPMAEGTMARITLHEIEPLVFRTLLRFVYTDSLPADRELGDSCTDMIKHLLAAADRYALDRLKLVCAQKLWETVSIDTVADALSCADVYSCQELRSRCIDFVMEEKNFKKTVLTESFMTLMQNFPSILAELRAKVGA
ncbi:BTB/POZ and MATH domain-containing protein 1-like [Lolium rigidum]|uniref:BTB/POZ and MATH domain-containing protein 1-like n=1 Tax=Lolium rigidum TaxID=89674 RepID=UPI001F5E2D8F|nr:BTB/POZ and MATH domain-containing protein 1-like [Lolium rigidum]